MKFLKKWFCKPKLKAKIYEAKSFGFSEGLVEKNALNVLSGLDRNGYDAYLVGGVLRDLLSGIKSKDCDVVTNARPEKIVKKLKNSIIVGRRFRIVHVRFGRQIVEVSTFRSSSKHVSAKGIIKKDNVYGDIDDDVMRRDFTINALYYRYRDKVILDFVGGLQDLQDKRLKSLGDPLERFLEDPVRMLRAVRFSAKLGLTIDSEILNAIEQHKRLLAEISGQRLFAEIIKIYYSGYAQNANQQLNDFGILEVLIPEIAKLKKKDKAKIMWDIMAENADKRYHGGRRLSVTYLFACLYWPVLFERIKKLRLRCFSPKVANEVLSQAYIDIPFRVKEDIFEIWRNQFSFRQKSKAPNSVFKSKRLRASYELLCQRAMIDPGLADIAIFWEEHV